MSVGVHSFQVPHDHVQPTRDMVIIRIPMPPSKIGSIHVADITRDITQHNVMAGMIMAKGPLAFQYKDADDAGNPIMRKQEANVGDWVLIRPFAGTLIQNGAVGSLNGYRYVSSFQDVIGIIPAANMPDPATLEWDMKAAPAVPAEAPVNFAFDNKKDV